MASEKHGLWHYLHGLAVGDTAKQSPVRNNLYQVTKCTIVGHQKRKMIIFHQSSWLVVTHQRLRRLAKKPWWYIIDIYKYRISQQARVHNKGIWQSEKRRNPTICPICVTLDIGLSLIFFIYTCKKTWLIDNEYSKWWDYIIS